MQQTREKNAGPLRYEMDDSRSKQRWEDVDSTIKYCALQGGSPRLVSSMQQQEI